MTAVNVQEVVHGVLIVVTLAQDGTAASFNMRFPKGQVSHPKLVDIRDDLKAGLSEREALQKVLATVKGVVESAAAAGIF